MMNRICLVFMAAGLWFGPGQLLAAPQETAPHEQAQVISVADFGVRPNTRENAVPAVRKALEACRLREAPVLVFPKGRYDFWPHHCTERVYYESNTTDINPKRCAILIEKFKNLTVECSGSEFVFHDRMQPFTVDHSEQVTIRNVHIDWDIPLTAQAEVADVTDAYMDLKINVLESPYIIEDGKLVFVGEGWKSRWWGTMEFERDSRLIPRDTGDRGCLGRGWNNYRAEEVEPGLVRLHHRFTRRPAMGNVLVLRHSARDHAGMFLFHSKAITLENVHVYHTAGLGILSQYAEDLHFKQVHCMPNRAKGRYLSGHDDGLHFSNCRGRIQVEGCTFAGLMDDPINVHGTSVRVIDKLSANKLLCQLMHHQSVGLEWARPRERIGFIENESMSTVATGVVTTFGASDLKQFEIAFAEAVPEGVEPGDALENLTWTPDVSIRDCTFGSCRARGVLISTPGKVIIEDNTFESSGSAILIAGDANQWYESGAVRDVVIRRNLFKAPCLTSMYQFCEGIISIDPEIPRLDAATKPFHRDIRIVENTFHAFDYPLLYAKSVEGLSFRDNRIVRSRQFEPFHPRRYGFTFVACREVEISGNRFEGDVLGRNVELIQTTDADVTIDPEQGLVVTCKAK